MLACRPHWYSVPKPLRDAVWAAWEDGAGSPAHTAAIDAAIRAMNKTGLTTPDTADRRPSLVSVYRSLFGDCIGHEHKQVGHCVYCVPCGRRLYQGTVMPAEEIGALREWLAADGTGSAGA
jgi:hypothetical protein